MRKFFSDFKKFIFERGNILDLAIAVIIGGAFGKIVTSLVNDIIMPIITLAMGGQSVNDLKWVITKESLAADGTVLVAENALRWGMFLQSVIDFLIIALCIFIMIRIVMKIKDGYKKFSKEVKKATCEDMQKKYKELKAQGMKHKDIKAEMKRLEKENLEKAKAEEERKKAEEEANKPPTTDELLTQIRDLLAGGKPEVIPDEQPEQTEQA